MATEDALSMASFEVMKCLGRGAFAAVHLVKHRETGEELVVKKFHKPLAELSPKEREEVMQEVKVLSGLRHPNIIQFIRSFVENDVMHILMEYASGGTLHKRIVCQDGELFSEAQIMEWFVQMLMALGVVHAKRLMHRDLKTQNVMLGEASNDVVKLGDFGIAKVLGTADAMGTSMVGTPYFLSPELCDGKPYDQKSDVWALGCILYELCTLRKPFDASNLPAIFISIMRNRPEPIDTQYSQELRDLCDLLLDSNPDTRPTVKDLHHLDFIQLHRKRWLEKQARLGGGSPTATTTADSLPAASPILSVRRVGEDVEFSEEDILADLKALSSQADVQDDESKQALNEELQSLHDRLTTAAETGHAGVTGKVWEAMGRAWAESGEFWSAIKAYRQSLRTTSGSESLTAMEQLGNLLVREAVKIWQRSKSGEHGESVRALKKSKDYKAVLLGRSASSMLGHRRSKSRRLSQLISTAASASKDSDTKDDSFSDWSLASFTMLNEGVGLLERLCSIGETAERRCLLGSAYKRQAWTGLGESRKADLQQAAKAYAVAHRLEVDNKSSSRSVTVPSPYARLNQLTLELLGGSGDPDQRDRLLLLVKQAEEWAVAKREQNPSDVWLWVQAVDAQCLRLLLGDPAVKESAVLEGYRKQFAFGASQRVKSSVLDQMSFMLTVLEGRLVEESDDDITEWLRTINTKVQQLRTRLVTTGPSSASLPPSALSVTVPPTPASNGHTPADVVRAAEAARGATDRTASAGAGQPSSAARSLGSDTPHSGSQPPVLPSPAAVLLPNETLARPSASVAGARERPQVPATARAASGHRPPLLPSPPLSRAASAVSDNPFARRSSQPYRSRTSSVTGSQRPGRASISRSTTGGSRRASGAAGKGGGGADFPTLTTERLQGHTRATSNTPPVVAVLTPHQEGHSESETRPVVTSVATAAQGGAATVAVASLATGAGSSSVPRQQVMAGALHPDDRKSVLQCATCCCSFRVECFCCASCWPARSKPSQAQHPPQPSLVTSVSAPAASGPSS